MGLAEAAEHHRLLAQQTQAVAVAAAIIAVAHLRMVRQAGRVYLYCVIQLVQAQ